jgi:hypothetical protein
MLPRFHRISFAKYRGIPQIPGEKTTQKSAKVRYYIEITVIQKQLQYFVCNEREHGNIDEDMDTWKHGNIQTWKHGDVRTCSHGNMKTWQYGNMETWLHEDMKT